VAGEPGEGDALRETKRSWERFGSTDALWAVLADPAKSGGRWDVEEFFASGREDVAEHFARLQQLGVEVPRDRCLDFGCGVGRLTQALCERFEECHGVDIAGSMIAQARRFNRHGERCRYHVNDAPDLRLFRDSTFGFVLSLLVLQHMKPEYALGYVAEFFRVLRPGGVAFFQVPAAHRPRPVRPLPDRAFRATVRPKASPDALPAGGRASITVAVRNDADQPWPPDRGLRVGNHWWRGRRLVGRDDGRSVLPGLAAGATAEVTVPVRVPDRPGRYELELDVVQEGVAWFAERGSTPARVPVRVRPPIRHPVRWLRGVRRASSPPVMEMHCIPREEVSRVIAAGGGRLVDAYVANDCGEEYESVRYVAVKGGR
jgi:SAM-dependent methyltransferase